MTSLLIDDCVALDAGSLSQAIPIERQRGVHSVVLTHSHIDHTCSLPFFIENVYDGGAGTIDVYGSEETIYSVRKHLFNNATWPDFTRLPNHLLPAVQFHELKEEEPTEIGGVNFTPIRVNHLVPTFGFLVERDRSSFLWSSDTGPTVRLWELANHTPGLKMLGIETSFDNSMQGIADLSFHLTPQTLESELEKLTREVPILLHHLKPPCIERIRAEVATLQRPDIGFLEQGRAYRI